jgi:hypothetical protein
MLWKRHARVRILALATAVVVTALVGCSQDNTSSPVDDPNAGLQDQSPPTMPTGLCVVKASEEGFLITWTPSPDLDIVGYDVYLYQPSPYRDEAYIRLNTEPVTHASFSFPNPEPGEVYYFKVRAVDSEGLKSASSGPLEVSLSTTPEERSGQGGGRPRDPRAPGEPPVEPGNPEHPRPGDQYPDPGKS